MTYATYGDESVLELRDDVPRPKVAPSTVRIAVSRASVNPVDWKLMAGGLDAMIEAHFPVVPGWDVAGVVESVGPDTPEFSPGNRVASYGRLPTLEHGTFAEEVTLPVEYLARIPEGVSDDLAAALPLTGLTARRAIDALDLREGETVLVHAASGGVGYLASQLAARTGARVIGTASQANAEKLRAVGVEPVEYGDGLAERVRELVPDGIDAAADFVGGVLDVNAELLRDAARQVSIADPEVTKAGGRWIWVRPDGAALEELLGLVAAGELRLDIDTTFPLEKVAEAFARNREGRHTGKILIAVS